MKRRFITIFSVIIAFGAFSFSGCDIVGSNGTGGSDGTGTLKLGLTDAPFPFDLVAEANVTIDRVEIVGGAVDDTTAADSTEADEEEIITLVEQTEQYNLLALRDSVASLTEKEIPAGSYSQIRLIVSDASILLKNGDSYDLKVPSGAQTGIKVLLPNFRVEEGIETELTLDFVVSESFVVQGDPSTPAGIKGFIFTPVIKPEGMAGEDESQ